MQRPFRTEQIQSDPTLKVRYSRVYSRLVRNGFDEKIAEAILAGAKFGLPADLFWVRACCL